MGARVIRLCGEINSDLFQAFSEKLAKYEAVSDDPVEIELNSTGGMAYDGMAIAGRMRVSACPINVTVYGSCQSAAIAILAVASHRACCPWAWLMVHEDSEDPGIMQTKDVLVYAQQKQREEDQWNDLLAQYTETPSEAWAEMSKRTTYLDAKQAYQLGLVDEILKGKK